MIRGNIVGVFILATSVVAAAPTDNMSGRQIVNEIRTGLTKLALTPTVNMEEVNKLNRLINALEKHMPAHADGAPVSGMEQGVDTAVHAAFHPIEELRHQMGSFSYDVKHITGQDSAWGLLKGFLLIATLYLVIGMIIMRKVYDVSGIESLPHLSFWIAYPGLVMDGVSFVMDRLGFSSPAPLNGYTAVATKSGISGRDTFSQFEPI
jgi:hypothetical protein